MRWIALTSWLLLLAAALLAAPPADPATREIILQMLRGDLAGVNLSLFALFNLMGVWPIFFAALLAFDTTEQRIWRWPFVLGAFAGGAFALLPYLFLRRWGAPKRTAARPWLRAAGSRGLAVVLTLAAAALSVLFLFGGGLGVFARMVRTDQFSFVMSCDFLACTVAGLLLAYEDARARPGSPTWLWALASAIGAPLRLAIAPLAK